jgi:hypothetical protein
MPGEITANIDVTEATTTRTTGTIDIIGDGKWHLGVMAASSPGAAWVKIIKAHVTGPRSSYNLETGEAPGCYAFSGVPDLVEGHYEFEVEAHDKGGTMQWVRVFIAKI